MLGCMDEPHGSDWIRSVPGPSGARSSIGWQAIADCVTQGMGGLSQLGVHVHRYLAGRAGALGLHTKAAYEKSSSNSAPFELNCSLLCEKKHLVAPRVLKEDHGCPHSPESAVGFVNVCSCACRWFALPNWGGNCIFSVSCWVPIFKKNYITNQ